MEPQQLLWIPHLQDMLALVLQLFQGPEGWSNNFCRWTNQVPYIDMFFQKIIPMVTIYPDGVSQYKSTLQYLASSVQWKDEELQEGEEPFDIDSPIEQY